LCGMVLSHPIMPRSSALLRRPAPESARIIGRKYLNKLMQCREALGSGDDVAALHEFRVALRRLRGVLRAFRSELELEDTKVEGGQAGGEVALEQIYLDYMLSPAATIRAGLVLPPIGIINEVHEPPTFNGVERPSFEVR